MLQLLLTSWCFLFSICAFFYRAFGNSLAEVWLEYAEAELTCGDHVKAAGIHWRGVKTLQDPAYFIAEYSTRFAGVKV